MSQIVMNLRRNFFRIFLLVIAIGLLALSVAIDFLPGSIPGFGTKQLMLAVTGIFLLIWSFFVARIAWQKQVLAGAAILLSIGVAELLLRLLYAPYLSTNLQLDEECLYRPIPGARHMWRPNFGDKDAHVLVEINEDGYRGPPLRPREEALRVAVFGDSFIMAEFTPHEETFVKQLELNLADRLKTPVEAINAGVIGYGPGQVSVRLTTELDTLRPDLLVVGIFAGNDFGDPIRNKLFWLNESGELVPNDYQISNIMRQGFADANSSFLLYKLASRWFDRFRNTNEDLPSPDDSSELRKMRFAEWHKVLVTEYRQFVLERDNAVEDWSSDRYDVDVATTPNSDSALFKKRMMKGILGRIQQTASDARIPLLVVTIPSSGDVCDDSEVTEVDTEVYPEYRREALTDAVAGAAKELGIHCVDLFSTMRRPDARSLYLYFDDHWNAAGQNLCAGVVADFIIAKRLLESSADSMPVKN